MDPTKGSNKDPQEEQHGPHQRNNMDPTKRSNKDPEEEKYGPPRGATWTLQEK